MLLRGQHGCFSTWICNKSQYRDNIQPQGIVVYHNKCPINYHIIKMLTTSHAYAYLTGTFAIYYCCSVCDIYPTVTDMQCVMAMCRLISAQHITLAKTQTCFDFQKPF